MKVVNVIFQTSRNVSFWIHIHMQSLKVKSICTDTVKDVACVTVSSKSFVCAHKWHRTPYGTVYVFVIFMHTEECAFPLIFPYIGHGTNSFETIARRLFEERSAVIIKLAIQSNVFLDQYFELLCFILHDFADLRHRGWITCAFPTARKNDERRHKKWRKWETRPSVHQHATTWVTTWIKINIFISGSTAVSVSMHMESCNTYFYFLLENHSPLWLDTGDWGWWKAGHDWQVCCPQGLCNK